MKKIFLVLSFLSVTLFSWAQVDNLVQFNQERLRKQKASMQVLGSWAVGNIALGLGLQGRYDGEERYFHRMNAGWNVINLGLATAGYLSAIRTDPASFDLSQSIEEHHKIQKIFLFNAGLDVGYVLGGLYLRERGKTATKNSEQLKGFGKSIMLQGGFLFAFDLVAYFAQASGNKNIGPLLSGIHFNGQQLGLVLQF